jgi:DNA-binding XRE family transcriptional regulator
MTRDPRTMFGRALRDRRQAAGLTQTDAATILEISRRTLQTWETDTLPHPLMQQAALDRMASAIPPDPAA